MNNNLYVLCDSLKEYSNVIFTDFPAIHHYYIENGLLNQIPTTVQNLKFYSALDLTDYIEQLNNNGYSFYIFNGSVNIVINPMDFTPMIVLRGKAVKGLKVSPMKIKQKDNDRRKYLLLA